MSDLATSSAVELAAAVRAKEVSSVELLDLYLVTTVSPSATNRSMLNAVIWRRSRIR